MKNLLASFGYAFKGFSSALRSEQNLRIHVLVAIMVVVAGFFLKIERSEWLIIILCISLVFTAELFNTAIEKFCDIYTTELNAGIKMVKDISAAAVFTSVLFSVVCGLVIFLPYLITLFNS